MSFEVHQEQDRVRSRRLLAIFAGAVLVTAVAILSAWLLLQRASPPRRDATPGRPPPRAPAQIATVEQTPVRETARGLVVQDLQRDALRRWAWVDRDAGVAEIPVDVAMELMVRRAGERGARPSEEEGR